MSGSIPNVVRGDVVVATESRSFECATTRRHDVGPSMTWMVTGHTLSLLGIELRTGHSMFVEQ